MQKLPRRLLTTLVFGLPVVAFSLYRSTLLPEGDLLWQIRTGNETLLMQAIPRVNEWGWLVENRAWMPNSWLWNVLLAAIFNTSGIFGLCALTFALSCLLFWLAHNFLRQLHIGSQAQFIILVLMGVAMLIWITTRPQEADYLLLLTWMNLLPWLAKKSWAMRLIWLPPLAFGISALWMNLHLSATIAIVLFPATYWLVTSLMNHGEFWQRRLVTSLAVLLATALGALATPFGLEGVTKVQSVASASIGIVTEWSPIDFTTPGGLISTFGLLAFGLAPLALALKRRQWLMAGFLLCFSVLAEQAIRFMPLLIITSLIAAMLVPKRLREANFSSLVVPAFSGAMVLVLSLSAAAPRFADPASITLLDPSTLRAIPANSRVLTMPEGGDLMLLYRPDISPSLDGRNDIYGQSLYRGVANLYYFDSEANVRAFLKDQRVDAVYLEVGDRTKFIKVKPTIAPVMARLGWIEHDYAGAKVWVRPGA